MTTRRTMQECVFFLRGFTHSRGERPNQSVAQQNAEESADERGGNFFPNFFRRSAQRSPS